MHILNVIGIYFLICHSQLVLTVSDTAGVNASDSENHLKTGDTELHKLFSVEENSNTNLPDAGSRPTISSAITTSAVEGKDETEHSSLKNLGVSVMEGGDNVAIENINMKSTAVTDKPNQIATTPEIQKATPSIPASNIQQETLTTSTDAQNTISSSSNNSGKISPRKGVEESKIVPRKGVGTPSEEDVTSEESLEHSSSSVEENGQINNKNSCACCPNITLIDNISNESGKNACVLCCKQASDNNVPLSNNTSVNSSNISSGVNNISEGNISQSGKGKDNLTAAAQPVVKNKKPLVTLDIIQDSNKNATSHEQQLAGGSSQNKTDYVVPVVAIILAIPLVIILAVILYKKGSEFWERRHYRRMDFLIDGMYNE